MMAISIFPHSQCMEQYLERSVPCRSLYMAQSTLANLCQRLVHRTHMAVQVLDRSQLLLTLRHATVFEKLALTDNLFLGTT
jgi:hypothetical protein